MMSIEEKLEAMQRERIAYKEGYKEGYREDLLWAVILAGCLVCVGIVLVIT